MNGVRGGNTNTETTEGAGLRKQLYTMNRGSKESEYQKNERTESGGWGEGKF